MTRHYPDLSSASDWLNQISHATRPMRSTTQICIVTRHQYGISALVSQTSFGGKPVVASPNVGCFLRLEILVKNVCISDCKISLASSYYNWLRGTGENAAQGLARENELSLGTRQRTPVHPSFHIRPEGTSRNSWWSCAPPFSKSWPYFRPKKPSQV